MCDRARIFQRWSLKIKGFTIRSTESKNDAHQHKSILDVSMIETCMNSDSAQTKQIQDKIAKFASFATVNLNVAMPDFNSKYSTFISGSATTLLSRRFRRRFKLRSRHKFPMEAKCVEENTRSHRDGNYLVRANYAFNWSTLPVRPDYLRA